MLSANLQAVILDLIIHLASLAIALWFGSDLRKRSFRLLTGAFLLLAVSYTTITIGDVLIALGYNSSDFLILTREWRALPWRYGAATALTTIAAVLRFGTFNGDKNR